MRTSGFLLASAGALALLALPGTAQAQEITAKPVVMILLDSSGSMEYEAEGAGGGAASDHTVPDCEDPDTMAPVVGRNYRKSRLIVAQEVLTGTYVDYWCRYNNRNKADYAANADYGYSPPHIEACSGTSIDGSDPCRRPVQQFNGLLDIRWDDFKFGLMTFDNKMGTETDAAGMYSYGPDKTGGNLGARNAEWGDPNTENQWLNGKWSYPDEKRTVNNRGQLIPPSLNDSYLHVHSQNRLAQYELSTVVGYWGTALAPLLSDALYFFQNDESVKQADSQGNNGDPYYNCRERVVILITDGRASQGEGVLGYPTTPGAIQALKTYGIKVYVIGFALADEDSTILGELDPENGGPSDGVYMVSAAQDLATAIADVFDEVLPEIRARSTVAFTNATRSSYDQQYQFNAAYGPDLNNPLNQVGYLNQTIYRCKPICAMVGGVDEACPDEMVHLHSKLDARANSERSILAVVEGTAYDLDPDNLVYQVPSGSNVNDTFGVPEDGTLPPVEPGSVHNDVPTPPDPDDALGEADDTYAVQTYLRSLFRLIRADDNTMRHHKKTGGIGHATPVIQEPAIAGLYPLRSWNKYVDNVQESGYSPGCRPTVLVTGTHDGLIHGFRVDRLDNADGTCAEQVATQGSGDVGTELWAIMPHHLLKRAHDLAVNQVTLMDGQPHVADILLARINPKYANLDTEAGLWRSVMTTGYGEGGRGYIAIDMTNPLDADDVSVLYEIDNERRCVNGTCHLASLGFANDFSKLGLTTARPAYGTAFLGGQEVAIAFLPGGLTPEGLGGTDAGHVVYIVRMDPGYEGVKVAEFSKDVGNLRDMNNMPVVNTCAFTSSVTPYSATPGVVTTRGFVGDSCGRLWRIDMSDVPSLWKMQLFFDAYGSDSPLYTSDPLERIPVFGAPAVALASARGNVTAVFGTGHIDFLAGAATARAGVFSVAEELSITGDVSVDVRWKLPLEEDELLTGEPVVFGGAAHFTTVVTNPADACLAGSGRLYGVHFTRNGGEGEDENNGTPSEENFDPVPYLDVDGDLVIDDVENPYISTGSAIPYGVQVVERPACFPNQGGGGDANTPSAGGGASSIKRGAVELVLNVAQGTGGSPQTLPEGVNAETAGTQTITHRLGHVGETLQSATWGYTLY